MPAAAKDFEKLGVFYLGRPYDLAAQSPRDGITLYDSRDLVTHAVCVGMTGSGKTGLCLALLEEAAIDGVPAIIIDPKGDLGNLLLTFPNLQPEDFRPWINEDDARRKGMEPGEFAGQQAKLWTDGLAAWGQDGDRIRRLRDAAEFAIYTPGSTAGIPVSILDSFSAPPPAIRDDSELLRERVASTVTGLLNLAGIDADPVRSREHILLSTILDRQWKLGRDLDLASIIDLVQNPAFTRVGMLDLETFFPSKDRFGLVMTLNNLAASPSFAGWLEGEPLDIAAILHTPSGKPRHAVFSIAHLGDAERMFFVSLLLNQMVAWMRAQPGTTSLRAILYMDEIFGFFPPVANPPSKLPLLTLLKQARAFGVGVVLATQNPVDLDYKGLANTGTWFIGRLQTERDKLRVLEGLEGAASTAGTRLDRSKIGALLSSLGNRVFLLHNVHESSPEIFETRWVMSYLRGPLTRDQIRTLMDGRRPQPTTAATQPAAGPAPAPEGAPPPPVPGGLGQRPTLPPALPQYFIPLKSPKPAGASLAYTAHALGLVRLAFADARLKISVSRDTAFLAPIENTPIPVDWARACRPPLGPGDLLKDPEPGAVFGPLPPAAATTTALKKWERELDQWATENAQITLLRSPVSGLVSEPEEAEREFRVRVQQALREKRDAAVAALREENAPKREKLLDRIQRAESAVEREKAQARAQQMQSAISLGGTLLGAFMGRRKLSATNLGRATTAARGFGRSLKEAGDVKKAEESVESLQAQLAGLDAKFDDSAKALESGETAQSETLEKFTLRPAKSGVAVRMLCLAWQPNWLAPGGGLQCAAPC